MAEPEQGPTLETYISAVRGALKWANPPVPEGVSPEDWRNTFVHAFDVVAAAARGQLRAVQEAKPDKPTKPPRKPRKAVAKSVRARAPRKP